MIVLKNAFESYGNVPIITLIASQDRSPFQVLIGTILSARTKDETTAQACTRLFKRAPTLEKMAKLSASQIEELIYPVGFSKTKAKHIKATTALLLNDHNGQVPDTMDDLLTLPGVGRKTANLVLGEAFKKQAICVDTHVHRISNLLGLLRTKTPHETERALATVLPKTHWILYNTYLVAHGQTVCRPTSPICSQCQIRDFCQRVGVERSR
ncbi:MAG: endonuclease III [Planctomycetes bacterium]|nr:endonuclease III [Planctomycetota bacterium]